MKKWVPLKKQLEELELEDFKNHYSTKKQKDNEIQNKQTVGTQDINPLRQDNRHQKNT